jgi:hypothetical protein
MAAVNELAKPLIIVLTGHSPDGADPSPILAPIGSLQGGPVVIGERQTVRLVPAPHPALKNGDLSVVWTHVPREFVPNP